MAHRAHLVSVGTLAVNPFLKLRVVYLEQEVPRRHFDVVAECLQGANPVVQGVVSVALFGPPDRQHHVDVENHHNPDVRTVKDNPKLIPSPRDAPQLVGVLWDGHLHTLGLPRFPSLAGAIIGVGHDRSPLPFL